jgi:hypothetical protein
LSESSRIWSSDGTWPGDSSRSTTNFGMLFTLS